MFVSLTPAQIGLVTLPADAHIFLEGPAGCGKTTAGVERLLHLMAGGVPGNQILLLLPQRALGAPYYTALQHPGLVAGGMVSVLTASGLAQRMIDLFWPLVVEPAGFSRLDRLPVFLTLETAQYYVAHLVQPLLDEGLFESVAMDRNRLYSQVLDSLNKSAVVGFSHMQIGERLKSAWVGEPGQLRIYDDVQTCANLFRSYCLQHNLLDFSLQIEVFFRHLWNDPWVKDYIYSIYQHLIVENLEEDTPVAHDFVAECLPKMESALLIYDHGAGYRSYLGADPESAYRLKELCNLQVTWQDSFISGEGVQLLGDVLSQYINPNRQTRLPDSVLSSTLPVDALDAAMEILPARFYPEVLDLVVEKIRFLIDEEQAAPDEIVVLAPFLSDALRFSLIDRLNRRGIPSWSHRPSRSLREEPVALCMLTLASLAHPEWGIVPARFDVAYALLQAIEGLDLVRSRLLVDITYRIKDGSPRLTSFDLIQGDMQERITFLLGDRFERLRSWIAHNQSLGESLDTFLSRLFGELISQPGFGLHADFHAGQVAANLIESIQKFRWAASESLVEEGIPIGREYLRMFQDGVIAATYLSAWQTQPADSVLLAPAYTFLMSNRPARYQFWLDAGSTGWSERLDQPLTHPYVLNRNWESGRKWTDYDEVQVNQLILDRLVTGLLRRCREKVFLGLSDLGEQGYEQRGPLLQAVQRVRRTVMARGGQR